MRYEARTESVSYPEGITRLVVLGDPHGDLVGLEAVVEREGRSGVAYVSVGDNVGYADGPGSSQLCSRLVELGVASVYGNHEVWMGEDGALAIVTESDSGDRFLSEAALRWSGGLPECLQLRFDAAPDLKVSVRHTIGSKWDYVQRDNAHRLVGDEESTVVFVGHSHAARIFAVTTDETQAEIRLGLAEDEAKQVVLEPSTSYVVDAGSLGRPGYYPDPGHFEFATYATLDLATRCVAIHCLRKPGPGTLR